jgi:hypothetical protein
MAEEMKTYRDGWAISGEESADRTRTQVTDPARRR